MSPARRKIAVLTGGRSSEHEIALASARSVKEALDPAVYDVVTVEIARDGTWQLESGSTSHALVSETVSEDRTGPAETLPVPAASDGVLATLSGVDVVIPVLHGPFGEDGTVQGLLELASVPYVGAGVLGSALAMDKDRFKVLMRGAGVPVTRSVTVHGGEPLEHPYDYPVFVKPARLGSSVGITKVRAAEELQAAAELALRHDEKILIEEFVDGIEVEVGVLGNRTPPPQASLPGEIVAHGFSGTDWYDWSSKYDEGGMDLIVPPRIAEERLAPRPGRRRRRLPRGRVRGHGPRGLLRHRRGRRARQRAEHDPRLHGDERLCQAVRGLRHPVPRVARRLVDLAIERHERRSRLAF